MVDQRDRVEDNPEDDEERLDEDVLRRPEEARNALRTAAEWIVAERAV